MRVEQQMSNRRPAKGIFLCWLLPAFVFAQSNSSATDGVAHGEPQPMTESAARESDSPVVSEKTPVFLPESGSVFRYSDALPCGQVLEDLEGEKGMSYVIPIDVGRNVTRIRFTISGGEGDADLYAAFETPPGPQHYAYRPYVNGNEEEILVDNPRQGRWYVMIHGYRAFRGVQFSVHCARSLEEEDRRDFIVDRDVELALYYELMGTEFTQEIPDTLLRNRLLNQQGREAFVAGRFDEALEIWTQWIKQDPENPRPVALVGDLHLRAGDIEESIQFYRRSLEMQPGQILLMGRLARILDQEAGKPEEARALLNNFSRLFPNSAGVALAQAEWLIRRNRYEEALEIIEMVVREDPENLNAMSLIHPLLRTQKERHENMRNMLRVGQLPGREINLGLSVKENDLLTRPESWVLMNFIHRMAEESSSLVERNLFKELLPREDVTMENFRIGRMSSNWISSREEAWGEHGDLVLSADPSQTEAFLRLVRSDAMHSGFVEAEIDDSQGFFWIYARRGQGNMIRFGFEENGQIYLQVWMNDHLVTNVNKPWSRLPGSATLRLEVQGDGAVGYVNGEPAFSSPVSIPSEMGLGWWGIAPWSAQYGTASVTVSSIAGGPLPKRLGLIPSSRFVRKGTVSGLSKDLIEEINQLSGDLSTLAPEWFLQTDQGELMRQEFANDLELRLLARYHRMRLLPMVRLSSYRTLKLEQLAEVTLRNRVDGFTFLVERMPDPAWLEEAEAMVTDAGITLHFVLLDSRTQLTTFREVCGTLGIFSGPRRILTFPLRISGESGAFDFSIEDPDMVIYMTKGVKTP
jgi:tetratricopeptide (TPR) repeat protein